MTFRELKKKIRYYKPAFNMDRILIHYKRQAILKWVFVCLCILFVYVLFFDAPERVIGTTYISTALFLLWVASEFFYNSLYKRALKKGIHPLAASLLLSLSGRDITKSFLSSKEGKILFSRLGIPQKAVKGFLASTDRSTFSLDEYRLSLDVMIGLSHIFASLVERDPALEKFLFSYSVQKEQVINVSRWLERRFTTSFEKGRWWARENLLRIPSVGTKLSFGRASLLEEFSLPIIDRYSDVLEEYFSEEMDRIQKTLIRSKEANALIVGGKEEEHIIPILEKKIAQGDIHPLLEYKQLFVLDADALVSSTKEKAVFENTFVRILNQIISAGNVILVIPDMPGFITNALSLGSSVPSLLDIYLASTNVQVLAFSESSSYHSVIEPNSVLRERFELILVDEKDTNILRSIVENYVTYFENRGDVFFMYDAIDAIVDGTERYFIGGSPIDEVSDVLVDIRTRIERRGIQVVDKEVVHNLFEEKTGIPMGQVGADERDILLHLEEKLHERIIGQDVAIRAIADAMRRARSGISDPKRPLGSFLFMGPTGVGKTETTKALAANFFKSEDRILRLDMSEYKTEDALDRLIGSFEDDKPGILTSMLRENPYGVLLLDEFEKTHKNVLDLFLQIIDEGVFSDMRGKKVNARNLIIVATSNAGSDMIWEYVRSGNNLKEHTQDIIDEVVKRGIFKPELINRFDGVIVFHPLSTDDLLQIADIMIRKLTKRIRAKGIDLVLSEDAKEYVVEKGSSNEFGARELNRVIQNTVEKKMADLLLSDTVQKGSVVELSRGDLIT